MVVRTPKDFTSQIEEYCPKCGCAMPLPRRASVDGRDDISPGNLKRLTGRSKKVQKGEDAISNLKPVEQLDNMAKYKDPEFREAIAGRYGIFLVVNDKGFLAPYPKKDVRIAGEKRKHFLRFIRRGMASSTYTITGANTWICCPVVLSFNVECWGGGASGGSNNTSANATTAGGGGGGGAYAKAQLCCRNRKSDVQSFCWQWRSGAYG